MSANSRTKDAADQLSGFAEPAGSPLTKPIEAFSGGVPNGERREVRAVPVLLGNEADAAGERSMLSSRDAAPAASPVWSDCSARSDESAGQRCPVPGPTAPTGGRRSAVPVAVAVVAVPAGAARRVRADRRVDDGQGREDVRVGRGAARRAAASSRKPASITERWSSVGPPLPTLYEIAAFGSPVLERRMK